MVVERQNPFPPGKRLAVSVHFPVEWWTEPEADYQAQHRHEYGARIGAWRLLEVFDRAGVKATCHLNGIIPELFPELAREIVARGHDLAGHSYDQSHPQYTVPPDEEREIVRKTLDTIEGTTGLRPRGWVSSGRQISKDTVRILAEEGMVWHSHHDLGDLPNIVRIGDRTIVDCPIQRYMNYSDRRFIGGKAHEVKSCKEIFEFFRSQIDALRGAAQYEPLCFQFGAHAYLSGLPAYAWVVQEMILYAKSFSDIWCVTTGDLAQRWLDQSAAEQPFGKAGVARQRV